MKSVKIYLENAAAAEAFVQTMRQFEGEYDLALGSYTVDAKSILGVMSLAMTKGTQIRITAEGDDEDAAIEAMKTLVESGCGE